MTSCSHSSSFAVIYVGFYTDVTEIRIAGSFKEDEEYRVNPTDEVGEIRK